MVLAVLVELVEAEVEPVLLLVQDVDKMAVVMVQMEHRTVELEQQTQVAVVVEVLITPTVLMVEMVEVV